MTTTLKHTPPKINPEPDIVKPTEPDGITRLIADPEVSYREYDRFRDEDYFYELTDFVAALIWHPEGDRLARLISPDDPAFGVYGYDYKDWKSRPQSPVRQRIAQAAFAVWRDDGHAPGDAIRDDLAGDERATVYLSVLWRRHQRELQWRPSSALIDWLVGALECWQERHIDLYYEIVADFVDDEFKPRRRRRQAQRKKNAANTGKQISKEDVRSRIAAGQTQTQIAAELGCSQGYISRLAKEAV